MPEPERKTLYLTGFGAFPGVTDNPTAAVARILDGAAVAGCVVMAEVLPVAWRAAAAQVEASVARLQPLAILHLGLAVDATTLRLEQNATNRLAFRVADVAGAQPQGEPVTLDLPLDTVLATAVDLAAVVAALTDAGLIADASTDAGSYVCNATYFGSLLRQAVGGPMVLFLHVPALGQGWGLGHLLTATKVVLEAMAAAKT